MAVTPKEAMGDKPEALKKRASVLELEIDGRLKAVFNGRAPVNFNLDGNEDPWVIEQMLKRFKAVGWSVTHVKARSAGDWDGTSTTPHLIFNCALNLFEDM